MKFIEITNLKMRKATPQEQDKLEFHSNKETRIPRIYKLFGMSGVIFVTCVLILAAWTSVFMRELQEPLFPVFVISWNIGLVYTLLSLVVYAGIYVWYRHKHVPFEVAQVYCADILTDDDDDDPMFVFQTSQGEQFTMMRSQFTYVPASFAVQLDYLLAHDTVNEQYLIYQIGG